MTCAWIILIVGILFPIATLRIRPDQKEDAPEQTV